MLFGGEYDFAQTVFEGVDKDSKYYDQARMGLVHVLYMQGKYDECIVRCDDLLKKSESMPLLIEKCSRATTPADSTKRTRWATGSMRST
ncbi:MAG: hypothetical protein ACLUSP_00370 [Christensenellales bacterium]